MDKTKSGAIFCVVISKKKFCQDKPSTSDGIHLCRGAAATFNKIANVKITIFIDFRNNLEILINTITEAIA